MSDETAGLPTVRSEDARVPSESIPAHPATARKQPDTQLIRYACTMFSVETEPGRREPAVNSAAKHFDLDDNWKEANSIHEERPHDQEWRERIDLVSLWQLWTSKLDNNVRFVIGQIEKAPSSGRLHIQFYVGLHRKIRLATIRKYFVGDRKCCFNAVKCRGTHGQNVAYVTKESTRHEKLPVIGDTNITGKDLEEGGKVGKIAQLIQLAQDSGIRTALEQLPVTGLQNIRNLQTFIQYTQPSRAAVRANLFLQGPPRCGKTRFAYALSGNKLYAKPRDKWFCGYQGERIILWDEIQTLGISTDLLLRATDRYPLNVEVKGGNRSLASRINIFTSNYPFGEAIYAAEKVPEDIRNAVRDRFVLLLCLTDKKTTPSCCEWPIISMRTFVTNPVSRCCIFHRDSFIYVSSFDQGDRFTPTEILECFTDAEVFTVPTVAPDSFVDPVCSAADTNHAQIQPNSDGASRPS